MDIRGSLSPALCYGRLASLLSVHLPYRFCSRTSLDLCISRAGSAAGRHLFCVSPVQVLQPDATCSVYLPCRFCSRTSLVLCISRTGSAAGLTCSVYLPYRFCSRTSLVLCISRAGSAAGRHLFCVSPVQVLQPDITCSVYLPYRFCSRTSLVLCISRTGSAAGLTCSVYLPYRFCSRTRSGRWPTTRRDTRWQAGFWSTPTPC